MHRIFACNSKEEEPLATLEINGINIFYEDLGNKESKHCAAFFNGAIDV